MQSSILLLIDYPVPFQVSALILKNISKSLCENTAFYTQVLHLMNKFNLRPPWTYLPTTVDRGCQTDDVYLTRDPDLATDESELEEEIVAPTRNQKRRTNISVMKNPKRYRSIIEAEKGKREARAAKSTSISSEENHLKGMIEESVPAPSVKEVSNQETSCEGTVNLRLPIREVSLEKIPLEELKNSNPIFNHFHPGRPSSVLYIKNLAKIVSPSDLEQLFCRFSANSPDTIISVDLKTTGRLRGQAFVTFTNCEQLIINEAVQELNGVVLKGKPMYVCYSKSTK